LVNSIDYVIASEIQNCSQLEIKSLQTIYAASKTFIMCGVNLGAGGVFLPPRSIGIEVMHPASISDATT
jgi:hypothetical protein